MSNKSGVTDQVLPLPHGGGALAGLGEKFAPDLHTGTGNFTVPVGLPKGRNGFGPQLALTYSSGHGNGPFGIGWTLSVPGVSRKTSRGVPRYDDALDVFVLSGMEDLVPVERTPNVTTFRPRREGTFARITRSRDASTDHWEVRTRDGLVSLYGTPNAAGADPAVIANPKAVRNVFSWKLSATIDTFGNRIEYEYERDTIARDGPHRWDQLYLKQIRYVDYGTSDDPQFLVRVAFVYEARPDPFSEYRAGFEIRTVRRCRRIEVYSADLLSRVFHFTYLDDTAGAAPVNGASLLTQIRIEGVDGKDTESLPPITLGYTAFEPEQRRFIPVTGAQLPPASLAHPEFEQADLFARGLPDIFQMDGEKTRYWRNLGDGRFDLPREMKAAPAGFALGDPSVQLLDANGDGRVDLLTNGPHSAGYFSLGPSGLWDRRAFREYRTAPTFSLSDPEVRLVDVDGDGVVDAVRSGAMIECFFNDPETGWAETRVMPRRSLEVFPNVSFSDPRVKWADMTGDGLQDVVFVHDRVVEYWPSLGRGEWGARVTMANSPRLPDHYDPKRVLIGDVDGDGVADLVYVDDEKITIWINQAGNAWSDPVEISGTPPVSDLDAVRLTDLLGCGTAGILWTRDFDGRRHDRYFFLDLTGGTKPYLLVEISNGRGATTRVEYASSTRFNLEDAKQPATSWKTSLPFPVQVVARVQVIDALSGGRLRTEYRYHHGHWDGVEREFRGFGRVDQLDTERFEAYHAEGSTPFAPVAPEYFSPPTETRTWFHVGPLGDEISGWRELDYSDEFFAVDPQSLARPTDTVHLLNALRQRDRHDALRTLAGEVLRTELYARDGSLLRDRPYTVTEHQTGLREESPLVAGAPARHRVFFPHATAERMTQWERGYDPMTQLRFIDGYDAFGQPGSELVLGVPRGRDFRVASSHPTEPYLAKQTLTDRARAVDPRLYIVDRASRTTSYEFPVDAGNDSAFDFHDRIVSGGAQRRIFAQSVSFFDGPAFGGLPFGEVGMQGAVVRTEQLVLTDELVEAIGHPPYLSSGAPPAWTSEYPASFRAQLPPSAGYTYRLLDTVFSQGYFARTKSCEYDFQRQAPHSGCGLLLTSRDPLGHDTTIRYDGFDLMPVEITDPLLLSTQAAYDYRTLHPALVTDPNGNRTGFSYSPLGLLAATVVAGKVGEAVGDTPDKPSTVYVYDFAAFAQRGQPVSIRTVRRVHHALDTDVPAAQLDDTQETLEYSDGFGRVIQTRILGEDVRFGDVLRSDTGLPLDTSAPNQPPSPMVRRAGGPAFVVVTGWQIFDNKGRIIEKYEPFFSTDWSFEPNATQGVKAQMFYDPRGQVVRTVNPDGSEQRALYGVPTDLSAPQQATPTPWEVFTYDANDNASRTHPLESASYRAHWNTPSSKVIDGWGRAIEMVERNGSATADWLVTRSTYDVQGNALTVTDPAGRLAFMYRYDLVNRPLRVSSIDAGTRTTVYDATGSPIEQRDATGAVLLHAYDVAQRQLELWARDVVAQPIGLRERTEYGEGAPNSAARNLLGRLARQFDEAGVVDVAGYDFRGNLLARTRRVLSDDLFTAAPLASKGETYRVDWSQAAAQALDARTYRTAFLYDALNRVTSTMLPVDVTSVPRVMTHVYDRAGLLARVDVDGATYVSHIAYNAKGQRILVALGNGILTRFAYDPTTFRLVRLRSEPCTEAAPLAYRTAGAPLQDIVYTHDLVGNTLGITDLVPGNGLAARPNRLERVFEYDPVYRVLHASGRECAAAPPPDPWIDIPQCQDVTATRPYNEYFAYDPAGNLRSLRHIVGGAGFTRTFTPRTDSNRLDTIRTGTITRRYLYDASGNLVAENTSRAFEWDHSNRMRAFHEGPAGATPTLSAQYLYDAAGQRVKKVVRNSANQTAVTVYIDTLFEHHRNTRPGYVEENDCIHVIDDTHRVALRRLGPALSDDAFPSLPDGVMYHLADHLDSSMVVTDSAGLVLNREEHTAFGETSYGSFTKKRYRFTGRERDEETSLSYHSARYYAPWLARWITCDPLGRHDGSNLFAYVRQNPVTYRDPTGLESAHTPPTRWQRFGQFTLESAIYCPGLLAFWSTVNSLHVPSRSEVAERLPQIVAGEIVGTVEGITGVRSPGRGSEDLERAREQTRFLFGILASIFMPELPHGPTPAPAAVTIPIAFTTSDAAFTRVAAAGWRLRPNSDLTLESRERRLGGSYSTTKKDNTGRGWISNHAPNKWASPLPSGTSPAHLVTQWLNKILPSTGSGKVADAFREEVGQLINSGRFLAAAELEFGRIEEILLSNPATSKAMRAEFAQIRKGIDQAREYIAYLGLWRTR